MFDNFRNMDLKYKILVLASSAILITIMLSVLITVVSNMFPKPDGNELINQPTVSQSPSPSSEPLEPSPSSSPIQDVPSKDNSLDSDEMGVIYDVPLTSDEQVVLLQFAEKAYAELCTLSDEESYDEHFETVKNLFVQPDEYKNLVELFVKPADSQKCLILGSEIIGYDPQNGSYNVVVIGVRTKTYNGQSSEDRLLINMFIDFTSKEKMKIDEIR